MRYFPVFLDLEGRKVVVAGGGEAAAQKLRLLMKTSAQLFVFNKTISDEIAALAEAGRLVIVRRAATADDLSGAALGYAATGHERADRAFADLARAAGVPVNAVDRPEVSDFLTPAIVDRDPVTVAIGTEGAAPVLARYIKAEIEAMLPAATGAIARLAARWRGALAARLAEPRARRWVWQRFFAGGIPATGGPRGLAAAQIRLKALIGAAAIAGEGPGLVSLLTVPADAPELLTPKARRRLHEADVVVFDRGQAPLLRELARREAKFVAVDRAAGEILVGEAQAGRRIVRLIVGEDRIGRAGPEAAALGDAAIQFETGPGIAAVNPARPRQRRLNPPNRLLQPNGAPR